MLIALTDHLRCTEPHTDSWLVARADAVASGHLVDGALGCPVCNVVRSVEAGVLYWNPPSGPIAQDGRADAGMALVTRVGALVAYAAGDAPFVLCGDFALTAAGLTGLAEAPLVLIDPPDDRAAASATIIRGAAALPFAAGTVRGIVVSGRESVTFIQSGVRALRVRGRLVAPATCPVPAGIRELARDAEAWVGEREPASIPVPLTRAAKGTR